MALKVTGTQAVLAALLLSVAAMPAKADQLQDAQAHHDLCEARPQGFSSRCHAFGNPSICRPPSTTHCQIERSVMNDQSRRKNERMPKG